LTANSGPLTNTHSLAANLLYIFVISQTVIPYRHNLQMSLQNWRL